jgi:hypothetical protein
MSYDQWVIPEKFDFLELNIIRLIKDIEKDFSYLPSYIGTLSQYLQEQNEKYKQTRDYYYLRRGGDEYFPNALNYSFIILAFLTLENHLRTLTSILYEEHNVKKQGADDFKTFLRKNYRGGNFERYLDFYSSITKTPRSKLNYWPQIEKFGKLRDCIVHVSGYIAESRDQQEIERFIKTRDYFHHNDRQKLRPIYPTNNYFEIGELELDPYEERLVVGGLYCKKVCYYLESTLVYMLHDSGMAIYAGD